MDLIIVESPTKAKTITRFLSGGYKVESSFGHIRDLPKSALGIDVKHDFRPHYIVPLKARKVVSRLKKAAEKSRRVILATDEDREGEAIAWHLAKALGLKKDKLARIVFHEITKKAIENALRHPRAVNGDLVDAQQARRVLDRIVGYKLSPFLWQKVARRLSAGRVQSVAVRLVVERESEIKKFKPQEYWTIVARLKVRRSRLPNKNLIEAELKKIGGKTLEKLSIKTKKEAEKIVADLKKADYEAVSVNHRETRRHPLPPFTTSTLQQAAANRLGFSAKKTMFLAQQLYEAGRITYMRTDSVNLSDESTAAAKQWLAQNLGERYAGEAPRRYKTKAKGAQEAHEAIRPTDIFARFQNIKFESKEQGALYELIWRRFVASQMPAAEISVLMVEILARSPSSVSYTLRAGGQRIVFDGFLKIWRQKIEEKELPEVKKGDCFNLQKIDFTQHFTEPPSRYSEATLVKTLEELGIGRPSTYAPIISVIQERNYVMKVNGRFQPTPMGEVVNGLLVRHFPKIVDVHFTASMENDLDKIAAGKKRWQDVVEEFYNPFIGNLEEKYKTVARVKKPEPEKAGEKCEKCGREMVIRQGRFGRFMACSGFPECKNTKRIGASKNMAPKKAGINCPKCGKGEVVRRFTRRRHRPFWGCSRYPQCDYASWSEPAAGDNFRSRKKSN